MLLDDQRAFIVLLGDITERKKAEAEIKLQYDQLEALNKQLAITNKDLSDSEIRLSKSLTEKEILIREVYHRTKNTMQVIRGMIVLQASDFPSNVELQQLVKNTEDRIQAISLVHQMLYQSQDLSQISIKEYIQNLIDLLIKSYSYSDDRIAFKIAVVDHKFLLDTAIPLGLIINELITNSLKYAFPDGRTGIININLAQVESGNYLLTFSDNGVGVPDGFDFRNCESLGVKLIYSIGEDQMLGKIMLENNKGISCSLEFPGNLYKARV
jgi:two-component sensor histidine kinase